MHTYILLSLVVVLLIIILYRESRWVDGAYVESRSGLPSTAQSRTNWRRVVRTWPV